MLSVFERTREIGLLRAVGMRRRQVRTMIRSEAVILAVFGAVVGIVIGTALGLALVASLRQQGITETVVPVSSLLIFLLLSAVLGLIAATWPARRAARLGRCGTAASGTAGSRAGRGWPGRPRAGRPSRPPPRGWPRSPASARTWPAPRTGRRSGASLSLLVQSGPRPSRLRPNDRPR